MALLDVLLVNDAVVVPPGPPAWLAVKTRETGVLTKPLPGGPVRVPVSSTPIESGMFGLRATAFTVVKVSVNAPHDTVTSAPSGPGPVPGP